MIRLLAPSSAAPRALLPIPRRCLRLTPRYALRVVVFQPPPRARLLLSLPLVESILAPGAQSTVALLARQVPFRHLWLPTRMFAMLALVFLLRLPPLRLLERSACRCSISQL